MPFWRRITLPSYTEQQAQFEYRRYQESVTNEPMMTFLEWVRAAKIVLNDVPLNELAEIM